MSIVSPVGPTTSVLTDWPTFMKWIVTVPSVAVAVDDGCAVFVGDGSAVTVALSGVSDAGSAPEQPARAMITRQSACGDTNLEKDTERGRDKEKG